ncbi:MAG: plasma-membrane proton-efflux P-type ATPase [Nanoarchaeota archaeon]|nr:plasma-membrane proton-efflux P-type ATPase [Nanoarchaeota archaeon]
MIIQKDFTGLTSSEVEERTKTFGLNQIPEKKAGFIKRIAKWIVSPISLMLIAASVLSFIGRNTFDGYFIVFLLFLNFGVSFWQENKADKAIEKLKEKLAIQVKVLRDGHWIYLESKYLVPGDVLELDIGDIVPADTEIIDSKNLAANESVITGESLPKDKKDGDKLFSGSYISSGVCKARVTATGKNTFFGKTLVSIETSKKRKSILERDILRISKYLSGISISIALILTAFYLIGHKPLSDLLILDISLIIAGVPISLPTVMTLIISIGVLALSKENVIVRRLSSLEDFSNVNMLLTDKTGTLTKNQINVEKIITYNGFKEKDATKYSYYAIQGNEKNPVDAAIISNAKKSGFTERPDFVDFVPFDSSRKRSTATIKENNKTVTLSIGAPQVIEKYCSFGKGEKKKFEEDFVSAGKGGYRPLAIGIARGNKEKGLKLIGMTLLSDTPYSDIKDTVQFMKDNGIDVKMLTGDNDAIAKRVAGDLGFTGQIINRSQLKENDIKNVPGNWINSVAGFSEIYPEDKMGIVQLAQKGNNTVAVTGDGVNDLPAIHTADVGIAVSNGVDALKSSADIVLLSDGLSVIKTAIIEARKIFSRLYTYSIYRISESFRLILSIGILGLAYGIYPLTAIQIIILALLNDLPIITLAYDRVKAVNKPASIDVKKRFILATSFGFVGLFNSVLFFWLANNIFHLPLDIIQTMFFLKLTIGGHMLIYVAHTRDRWFKFLPSKQVIIATLTTQAVGTILAVTGTFMNQIPITYALIMWGWAFVWMQITDLTKFFVRKEERLLMG